MSTADVGWRLEHTYATLPAPLFARVGPSPARSPRLVLLNRPLAAELGLDADALADESGAAVFAGAALPPGAGPIAQAYAGHQFGGFTMLGDGRALLLGEQRTPTGGLFDIQLKGSGPTPFSRGGDGRAALGPMLREYIVSEGMHALGVPTTRSLAVATTGQPVFRDTARRGAVLTRVAASHIRVGTFQYAAGRGDRAALQALADYAIARHYSELVEASDKYLAFLRAVIDRQAALVARWLHVGFVHGVMNTDNMAISGETIDYGPCAFLDAYDPDAVFSSIDHAGRYAYGNQPAIAQWNLARFAETLLPLIDDEGDRAVARATEALVGFIEVFERHWLAGARRKLGLTTEEPGDGDLARALLARLHEARADYTLSFRDLSLGRVSEGLGEWHADWSARLEREGRPREDVFADMQRANPAVIPRNHRVEQALAAAENDDLGPLHALLAALADPFAETAAALEFAKPPAAGCGAYRTFCGT